MRRGVQTMTGLSEPQHDQAVQQHRHRGGALSGLARPALGLLEAQVLLGVVEGDLDRPAHRVPREDLLGRGVGTGRVERLFHLVAIADRVGGHHPQRSFGCGVDPGLGVGDAY